MAVNLDRRSNTRVACRAVVFDVDGVRQTRCRATNISEGGVYLRRLEGGVLLEGEPIRLELLLPGARESIWASGRVVEQVEETLFDAAAVRFTAMAATDRGRIRRYVTGVRQRQLRAALSGLANA